MARPLRVEFPGACYHAICRGNFRNPVFAESVDRTLVLDRFAEFAEAFGVRIRAYCVMVICIAICRRARGILGGTCRASSRRSR